MKIKPVAIVVLTACWLGSPVAAVAQNQTKAKTPSPTQAKKELDEAKAKLKDENQDLDKAEKEADKAEAARKSAATKVQQARQAAVIEHGRKLGLPVATGRRDAASRALESAHNASARQVRASAEHQAAAKAADEAKTRLESVRDDAALSDEKKKQLTSDLSKIIRAPVELERERLEADPQLRDLRGKLAEANKELVVIQGQVQKAAEDDAGVKTALQHEREAVEKVKAARAEVEKHKKEVAAAQKKVATENQQLQSAQSKAAAAAKSKKGKSDGKSQ